MYQYDCKLCGRKHFAESKISKLHLAQLRRMTTKPLVGVTTRKFGGKLFILYSKHRIKKNAKQYAQQCRWKGYNMRVVKLGSRSYGIFQELKKRKR